MRAFGVVGCVLLSGCFFANASAGKRLSESVNQMNRSTRWGQIADAARLVEPHYRPLFITNHRGWGQVIQVADSEVVHVELAPDSESALALVSYEWYLPDAMNLHQTMVRQRWSKIGSNFVLFSEAVVQGDARLLGGKAVAVQPAAADDDGTLGLAE